MHWINTEPYLGLTLRKKGGSVSTSRKKPEIGQNNKNKESVDYGEQCVLFYM